MEHSSHHGVGLAAQLACLECGRAQCGARLPLGIHAVQCKRDDRVRRDGDVRGKVHGHAVHGSIGQRSLVFLCKAAYAQPVGAGVVAVEAHAHLFYGFVLVGVDVPHILSAAGLNGVGQHVVALSGVVLCGKAHAEASLVDEGHRGVLLRARGDVGVLEHPFPCRGCAGRLVAEGHGHASGDEHAHEGRLISLLGQSYVSRGSLLCHHHIGLAGVGERLALALNGECHVVDAGLGIGHRGVHLGRCGGLTAREGPLHGVGSSCGQAAELNAFALEQAHGLAAVLVLLQQAQTVQGQVFSAELIGKL